MIQIKASSNIDTVTWSDEFVKVYLTNYLSGQKNEACIGKLDSEVVGIKALDSKKDKETITCSIFIPDNIGLSLSNCLPTFKTEIMCWCKGNVD